MDAGLVLVIVTAVGALLGIVIAGIRYAEIKLKLQLASSETSAANIALTSEVARLADRVAVLEKLVTDDDRRLASDIESLRRRDHANLPA